MKYKIDTPQLSQNLRSVQGADAAALLQQLTAQEEDAENLLIREADLSGLLLAKLRAGSCRFEDCRFCSAGLEKAELIDCEFISCDFSAADLIDSYFSRCIFSGCKLLGANFAQSLWKNVSMQDCPACFVCFDKSRWTGVEIESSDLSEAMLSRIVLKQLTLDSCNLSGSSIQGTSFKGVDLRGCRLENLVPGESMRELKGAIVDLDGAVALSQLMGIRIR